MSQRSGLSGESAYWLARRIIDRGLAESGRVPVLAGLQADPEVLVLSP
jgi:hypothetical protein